jgi:hypothetical protein
MATIFGIAIILLCLFGAWSLSTAEDINRDID